jgi:copper chaperone CopZ
MKDNKYEIKIEGMHCTGCTNLISMELEDINFNDINVDLDNNKATFTSTENLENIKEQIRKVFESEDIKKYKVVSVEKID